MKKRVFLIATLAIIGTIASVMLYQHFQPEKISSRFTNDTTDHMAYTFNESLDYVRGATGEYLIFIYEENEDAEFVWKSLLNPILLNEDVTIPNVTYINTTEATDLTVTQLRSAYGVERTPSFVFMTVDGKDVTIQSTLTYIADSPFSAEALRTWLFENGLWEGPYSAR